MTTAKVKQSQEFIDLTDGQRFNWQRFMFTASHTGGGIFCLAWAMPCWYCEHWAAPVWWEPFLRGWLPACERWSHPDPTSPDWVWVMWCAACWEDNKQRAPPLGERWGCPTSPSQADVPLPRFARAQPPTQANY